MNKQHQEEIKPDPWKKIQAERVESTEGPRWKHPTASQLLLALSTGNEGGIQDTR